MTSVFWDDLNEDLKDPEFRKEFFMTNPDKLRDSYLHDLRVGVVALAVLCYAGYRIAKCRRTK